MRILIAEDDPIARSVLQATLTRWEHEVIETCCGTEAWDLLQRDDSPPLALLDWMMPGIDGLELCRRARATPSARPVYLILLTARGEKEDIVAGLQAGADDFLCKPPDRGELQARIQVGVRTVELQNALAARIRELEAALAQIRVLEGILPICSYCKKVRDGRDYWQQVEAYISEHSGARFSHCICPECYERVVLPELEQLRSQARR